MEGLTERFPVQQVVNIKAKIGHGREMAQGDSGGKEKEVVPWRTLTWAEKEELVLERR